MAPGDDPVAAPDYPSLRSRIAPVHAAHYSAGCCAPGFHREEKICIRLVKAALAAVLLVPATAQARHYTVSSTAYCPGSSGTVMANGRRVHWGAVANNVLPLGARIRLDRPIRGRRWFTVEDRIGHSSQLDVWMPTCRQAITWGRRVIGFSTQEEPRGISRRRR